jgi:transposase
MDVPLPAVGTVTHLGIDDFALRRGRTYGTVLVDLRRHKVLDLLPDRKAETAKAWIQAHSEIKLVSRDRGGDYAAVQMEGESCRFRNKYLPLFGPYCEKSGPLNH